MKIAPLRDRIEMLVVEELNASPKLLKEPENYIPKFIQTLTDRLYEMVCDELQYRK